MVDTVSPESDPAEAAGHVPMPDPRPAPTTERPASTVPQEPPTQRDLADLRAHVDARRRWYREPALYVSVLAVVVSVVAMVLSQLNTSTDRVLEQRTRLTAVIQQIVDYQLENAKAAQQGQPPAAINTAQVRYLADEADRLMQEVPSTPAEKLQLAGTYQSTNFLPKALEIARRAYAESTTLEDKVAANRTIAFILFNQEEVEQGRAALRLARDEITDGQQTPLVRKQFLYELEAQWTYNELAVGRCAEGRQHLAQAETELVGYPNQLRKGFDAQLAEGRKLAAACD